MEKGTKDNPHTILSSMEDIVVKAKEHGLDDIFYSEAENSMKRLSSALLMSKQETLVLSLFFERCGFSRIRLSDIADMIHTSNIRLLAMMNVADELAKKGYLKAHKDENEKSYSIPMEVIDCIRHNTFFKPKPISGLSFDDFFDRMAKIFEEDDIDFYDRDNELEELLSANMHLPYCKISKGYDLGGHENFLLHLFAYRLICLDDDIIGTHNWEDLLVSKRRVRVMLNALKGGTAELITKGIFEPYKTTGLREPDYYHLTDKAKEELFPGMDLIQKDEQQDRRLIPYTSFAKKSLFYETQVQTQIDRLAELLDKDRFTQVTQRLSESGMRKGFACLFYGSPGTGKTETVNQLARITGRDVMLVDVTKIKSCWVGESEQNIKKLFDNYRSYVKKSEVAPILLFNEADAILGIRQESAERAVDKMENSIQNIILQEMESMEGIMIATTNLTSNLDKAFERRFIYKIEFKRPSLQAKQMIWKSMIPSLSDETALSLAKGYDLSGGQIENIARKCTVEYIISGNEPSNAQMKEFCESESMDSRQPARKKIGF